MSKWLPSCCSQKHLATQIMNRYREWGRPHFAVQVPEHSSLTDPTIDPQGSGKQDDRATASAESAGPLKTIGILQQFFHCHLDSHIFERVYKA